MSRNWWDGTLIMEADNTDQDKLEFSTYETVLNRLKLKDKKNV